MWVIHFFEQKEKIVKISIYYNKAYLPYFGSITSLTDNFIAMTYRNSLLIVNCELGVNAEFILSGKLLD